VLTKGRISALIELGAGFHPEISGRENIFINGIILGLTKKKIQEKLDDIVKFAELEDFIDNPVKSYSSGMYMRLGFSIAINVDPDILLVDEVLAVGDASFVPKCLDKINEFKRQGKTIIYVSHDLSTVDRISDDVIWLKNGKIEMRGYPKRVGDAYLEYIGKKDVKKAEMKHQEEEEEGEKDREKRWGSKEIEINNVKMIDGKGKEKYIYEADVQFRRCLLLRHQYVYRGFQVPWHFRYRQGQGAYSRLKPDQWDLFFKCSGTQAGWVSL